MQLLYVMDPMCAWCYGFQPELEAFLDKHPTAKVDWIMGGLAPDNDQPMDDSLKQAISSYWYEIETKTQVIFNHQYWENNTPYRSTYPACRAVISAEKLTPNSAPKMVKAIQSAYYQQAKNPSLETTLIDCAVSIGLEKNQFLETFKSEQTEYELQQHLRMAYQLQVQGFPALFYVGNDNRAHPLTLGFCQTVDLEQPLSCIKESMQNF